MVGKRVVLLRIEHFEQGRGGISPEVRAHLVDFIQQDHGVPAFRPADALDDAARHRADISAAMPADFRFIPQAAKGNTDEFAA